MLSGILLFWERNKSLWGSKDAKRISHVTKTTLETANSTRWAIYANIRSASDATFSFPFRKARFTTIVAELFHIFVLFLYSACNESVTMCYTSHTRTRRGMKGVTPPPPHNWYESFGDIASETFDSCFRKQIKIDKFYLWLRLSLFSFYFAFNFHLQNLDQKISNFFSDIPPNSSKISIKKVKFPCNREHRLRGSTPRFSKFSVSVHVLHKPVYLCFVFSICQWQLSCDRPFDETANPLL